MTAETQRTLIAVVRKAVFAGLVLLLAWLMLLGLRGAISTNVIQMMNQEMSMEAQPTGQPLPLPLNPWSWDWSRSLWSGKSVAQTVGQRLGPTLGLVGATALYSLLVALAILFVGMLISRGTNRPAGLARTRSVLRLLIISAAVSSPFFFWNTIILVYPAAWWGVPANSPLILWISATTAGLLPAWLLVQYGQGEIAKWAGDGGPFDGALWRHLGISLTIRVLRLVGAIIVLSMFVELSAPLLGLGRLFVDSVFRRDFPLIFGIAWSLVVIVVAVKLVADLIEIAYDHFSRRQVQDATAATPPARSSGIPRWWVYVSLGLVAASLIVAVAAPLIAPYGYNHMVLGARLLPPSSQYILGTDNLGRDVFSRLMFGIRQDVFLSLIAVGVMLLVAVAWAYLASRLKRRDDWRGDTLEDIVMLPRDVLYAFPWLVLLLLLMSFVPLPSGVPLTFPNAVLPVALMSSVVLLPRAIGVLQDAYRSQPSNRPWLHALLRSIPVMFVFAVAGGILYIATAGYEGIGVAPPMPELGGMLAGPARRYLLQAPWLGLWPPAVLVLLLFVWVMAGDALLERLGFRSKAVWSKMWE